MNVRCASFVNPKGMRSKNKPADMQKENQVKRVKRNYKRIGF
jgi:hypothetical protein